MEVSKSEAAPVVSMHKRVQLTTGVRISLHAQKMLFLISSSSQYFFAFIYLRTGAGRSEYGLCPFFFFFGIVKMHVNTSVVGLSVCLSVCLCRAQMTRPISRSKDPRPISILLRELFNSSTRITKYSLRKEA